MPQIFQVLKCYKCLVFQIHQTKKSNKWQCKLCGENQSIKRHYGIGNAKDCRLQVQKLNIIKGEIDEFSDTVLLDHSSCDEKESKYSITHTEETKVEDINKSNQSKWSNFIDEKVALKQQEENDMYLEDTKVVLEVSAKKRKRFKAPKLSQATNGATTMSLDYEPIHHEQQNIEDISLHSASANDNLFFRSNIVYKSLPKVSQPIFDKNVTNSCKDGLCDSNSGSVDESMDLKVSEISKEVKAFIPLMSDQNSKWTAFLDNSEENIISAREISSQTTFLSQENIQQNKEKQIHVEKRIFELWEENELDKFLDF